MRDLFSFAVEPVESHPQADAGKTTVDGAVQSLAVFSLILILWIFLDSE